MWPYSEVTRENFEERKDSVEQIMLDAGAEPISTLCPHATTTVGAGVYETVKSIRRLYCYNHGYYRVDEVLFPEKPFIVIEYADTIEAAENDIMEDTDPFPFDLCDDEIRREVYFILTGTECQ